MVKHLSLVVNLELESADKFFESSESNKLDRDIVACKALLNGWDAVSPVTAGKVVLSDVVDDVLQLRTK